jgi:hypothetical protein
MKATRGNRWSLRTPMLLAAVSGVAFSLSGCIIDGSTGPVDSDGDGIADIYDACPGLPETYNNFQDDDGCPDDGNVCLPDLTISWRIISNIDQTTPLTCGQAGNADTITAQIDGGAYGGVVHSFPSPCPANATNGSFKIVDLPASGTYNVSLELTAGATSRSETPLLVQPVDCSGLTATPVATMYVNF